MSKYVKNQKHIDSFTQMSKHSTFGGQFSTGCNQVWQRDQLTGYSEIYGEEGLDSRWP
jgi:hypothetical protein